MHVCISNCCTFYIHTAKHKIHCAPRRGFCSKSPVLAGTTLPLESTQKIASLFSVLDWLEEGPSSLQALSHILLLYWSCCLITTENSIVLALIALFMLALIYMVGLYHYYTSSQNSSPIYHKAHLCQYIHISSLK